MRYFRSLEFLLTLSLSVTLGSGLLVIPEFAEPVLNRIPGLDQSRSSSSSKSNPQQHYLGPKMTEKDSKNPPQVLADGPIMSDVVSIQKDVSIFAELIRGQEDVSHRLEDRNQNTTVLAPLNSVMNKLPRKPWEDPEGETGSQMFYGQKGEDRAARNLGRFVKAHVVPESPLKEGEKYKTLDGNEIWWENDENGVMRVFPDRSAVKAIRSTVSNGQVWVLQDIIDYPA